MLDTVGYVAHVIVNQRTGHLVDGHLRVEEALSHGQPSIPVVYVDLSDEEERLVLASLDPLAAMATTDEAKLRELLAEVSVDSEALAAMLAALAPGEPKDGLTDPDDVPNRPTRRSRSPATSGSSATIGSSAATRARRPTSTGCWTGPRWTCSSPTRPTTSRSSHAATTPSPRAWPRQLRRQLTRKALASSSRKRGTKALDAQGLHHSGFDVARGKSGIRRHKKLDVLVTRRGAGHPPQARAKDRPLVNDFTSDADFETLPWTGSPMPPVCSGPVAPSTSGAATRTSPTTPRR